METLRLVLFVQHFALRMKGFMLRADSGRVCLERDEMRFQFLEIQPVTSRAELRTMDLVKLLHEFGVRLFQRLLRRGKIINRRFGCPGHRLHLIRQRSGRPRKTRRTEELATADISETWGRCPTIRTNRTSPRAKR